LLQVQGLQHQVALLQQQLQLQQVHSTMQLAACKAQYILQAHLPEQTQANEISQLQAELRKLSDNYKSLSEERDTLLITNASLAQQYNESLNESAALRVFAYELQEEVKEAEIANEVSQALIEHATTPVNKWDGQFVDLDELEDDMSYYKDDEEDKDEDDEDKDEDDEEDKDDVKDKEDKEDKDEFEVTKKRG
jgi:hypothetical protein